MVGCVLSQLKPSERYILRCEKGFGSAKNVAHRGLYPGADPEGGGLRPFLRQIILKIP